VSLLAAPHVAAARFDYLTPVFSPEESRAVDRFVYEVAPGRAGMHEVLSLSSDRRSDHVQPTRPIQAAVIGDEAKPSSGQRRWDVRKEDFDPRAERSPPGQVMVPRTQAAQPAVPAPSSRG